MTNEEIFELWYALPDDYPEVLIPFFRAAQRIAYEDAAKLSRAMSNEVDDGESIAAAIRAITTNQGETK